MNPNENYMNQMPLPNTQPKSHTGSIIAVIIIIAIVAVGGWYFWNQVAEKQTTDTRTITPDLNAESDTGVNTELQADLEALQNDDLGESDLQEIDNEFNQ